MRVTPFRALLPNEELISSLSTFTSSVKLHYVDYLRNGFYTEELEPSMYVYAIQVSGRQHIGLLCSTDLLDSIEGHIIKHEDTLASKEQQMMYLIMERKAMLKPILLTYKPQSDVTDILVSYQDQAPILSLTDDSAQITHTFWKVSEDDRTGLQEHMAKVPRAYIADGHHRHSVMRLMKESADDMLEGDFQHLYSAYFSFDQLDILDYNRIVSITDNTSSATIMARLSAYFHVEVLGEARRPLAKHEIVLLMDYESYSLTWRSEYREDEETSVSLDANLFNQHVLSQCFDVMDIRMDPRITYVDGTKSLESMTHQIYSRPHQIGFLLYPVEMKDLISTADQGRTMPPKSTYFEPRLLNGLITQLL